MWDLTVSGILRVRTAGGATLLRPVASHQLHLAAVTGVAFCQRQPEVIATCSRDRCCPRGCDSLTSVALQMT